MCGIIWEWFDFKEEFFEASGELLKTWVETSELIEFSGEFEAKQLTRCFMVNLVLVVSFTSTKIKQFEGSNNFISPIFSTAMFLPCHFTCQRSLVCQKLYKITCTDNLSFFSNMRILSPPSWIYRFVKYFYEF